jgi:hypothetical protein
VTGNSSDYSTYATLKDVLDRLLRLEIMLTALIRNQESGMPDPERSAMLLNFAGVLEAETAKPGTETQAS